jgi:hypothetical protein
MIVHKRFPKKTARASKLAAKRSVAQRRVQRADGKFVTVLKLDADSKTFTDDLTYLFEKNVAKARRQNREILRATASGSSDD